MDGRLTGVGLGLRPEHYRDFSARPALDWVEIVTENYLVPGGKPLEHLERIRRDYPMAMHGVSLSIAGSDPLDQGYLRAVAQLARRIEPAVVSDHLCWTGIDGVNLHDLLPFPLTPASLAHVAARVAHVQDVLGRPLLLENPSRYLDFADDCIGEAQFLAELARITGCGVLLDVNNVYVSACNLGFDPVSYLAALPVHAVGQVHLAGHSSANGLLIDTHDAAVCEEVWTLYREAVRLFGPVPAMIERDDRIPPLASLMQEVDRLRLHLAGEEGHALAA